MKKLLLLFTVLLGVTAMNAQTLDELKAEQKVKQDSLAAVQERIDALQGKIDAFPGWKRGAFGTIGGNLSGFNNWYSKGTPNSSNGNIGIAVNAFANLDREKFFWRNSANANLSWVKLDDTNNNTDADADFNYATDVFSLTSLYGYKLSDKWAVSALGQYSSTIENFNNPGYLDLGVGATWTPIPELVVVIHPLNYNYVFSKNDAVFESSVGAKIVADYTKQWDKLSFKSNFSTFQSYKSANLSNWTWINSLGYTLWKGIGVGVDFGLRNNKQEALNNALGQNLATTPTFDNVDNKLQSYWMFGLNYAF